MLFKLSCTPAAADLIEKLKTSHNIALIFHQSGGCCDGSSPICYPREEFPISNNDILIGEVEDCPFYMPKQRAESWNNTHLLLDATPGRGNSFSLEAPEGLRFIIRSRLLTEEELQEFAN